MNSQTSRTADIRQRAKSGDGSAETLLGQLLRDLFQIEATHIKIHQDPYSLNSLNGVFDTSDGAFFFKFHQEEGEEALRGEYYRADILAKAGLPVDQPVRMSTLPGEQILIYRRRHDPRFSDVLRALDLKEDARRQALLVQAERTLNQAVLAVYLQTLQAITPEQAADEPVHQLFWGRLIDPATGAFPGGRLKNFYIDQTYVFPGVSLSWQQFSTARFRINGIEYRDTVGALFDAAHAWLNPRALANAGGVTAHGDAHNANVWFTEKDASATLSFFDPAFAGAHVPTLLAEVKTTFHNIFAHPLWLYEPAMAAQTYAAHATYTNGMLDVTTNWTLTAVRQALLGVKTFDLWKPLLQALDARAMLPPDWRRVVRLGLFLCPMLVMNLRAGAATHNPVSSLIGFSMAVMAGSEPVSGTDLMTTFFDNIDPQGGVGNGSTHDRQY